MLKTIRSHLRSNVVNYIALFVAMGGTAAALGANTIGTVQIQPFAIHNSDIAANQVNYRTLGTNSVGSRNLGGPTIKEATVDVLTGFPNAKSIEVACDTGQKVIAVGTRWLNTDGTAYDGPNVYVNYAKLLTFLGAQGARAEGANDTGTTKRFVVQASCVNR